MRHTTMTFTFDRRTFLGGAAATTIALTAGCLGGDDDGNSSDDEFDGWFDGVSSYDGVVDETGSDQVTVDVGTGSDGLSYSPAAISVDAGTTVVWEWTGQGGSHDVTDEDGAFQSELLRDPGDTFEYTFDETGTYLYYCTPHRGMGMKGAVVVE